MTQPGVFIVLEGVDGSGKSTQFRLTIERLKAVGHDVEVFKFPQYDQPSSSFVKAYLNGDYGPASEVSPYTASMFYALDRYHASPRIKQALADGKVVVADRYVGSNMAHQGSKFTNFAQQRGFFVWEDSLEFELLGIPRPNLNIFLKVSVEISLGLMGGRSNRAYTDKKLDQHEADAEHLSQTIATYDLLCKLFPKDFKEIDCTPKGRLLGIVQINDLIWQAIKPLLPEPKRRAKAAVVRLADEQVREPKSKAKNQPIFAVPTGLSSKLSKSYEQVLNKITDVRQKMRQIKDVDRLTLKQMLALTTPLAADYGWLEPVFQKPKPVATKPNDDPMAINKILDNLVAPQVPEATDDNTSLKLLEATPRNELGLLGQDKADRLTYPQKKVALKEKLSQSLSQISYRFEANDNYLTLKSLIDERIINQPRAGYPSTRLGYSQPQESVESSILEDYYNQCFKLSADLYSQMLAEGHSLQAPYVLLYGHINRWRFSLNAEALSLVLGSTKTRTSQRFLSLLAAKIAEVHPLVAAELSAPKQTPKTPNQRLRNKG